MFDYQPLYRTFRNLKTRRIVGRATLLSSRAFITSLTELIELLVVSILIRRSPTKWSSCHLHLSVYNTLFEFRTH